MSLLASTALAEEVDRRAKVAALEEYLKDLEAEHGLLDENEVRLARLWVDQLYGSE